jgi:CDP-glycerol glycerophosphotransferase (TagB/SpsB family)
LGKRFSDNPRYLFQYCNQHKEELNIRPIWLSHDRDIAGYLADAGVEAYYYHSWKGIWYALIGKVYLYDHYSKDINFAQSGGAVKVDMWHGIPLKKIQADNSMDKFRHPKNWWENWKCQPRNISSEKPSDHILATSEYLKPLFESAFRNPKNVFVCGYPRNDYLISDEINNIFMKQEQQELDYVNAFQKKYPDGRVVYYMPTYRDSQSRFFDIMNLDAFAEWLREQHILFCIKQHPFSKHKGEFAAIQYDNIFMLEPDSDPYVVLKQSDALITDYSSIYFDYLMMDRPIIFFDYDREEYEKSSRELYWNYEDSTPGEKVETMEGLMQAIQTACYEEEAEREKYGMARRKLRDQMFDNPEELSSPRMVELVKKMIEK